MLQKTRRFVIPTWFIIVLLLLSFSTACEPPTIEATETPVVIIGDSVFAGVYVREPDEAIDIVFVPDDDYGDMSDVDNRQSFLDDVSQMIWNGFWQNNVYFANLFSVNYWFMTATGDVAPAPEDEICPTVTWPDLDDALFAEAIVLLHPNPLRDCAWGNRVTSEPTSFRTVVHESGHGVFGLPDEYCCDGGYSEHPPILYRSENSCENDPLTNDAEWRDCQCFTDDSGRTWCRSEDNIACIMATAGALVAEFGPADWIAVRDVLDAELDGRLVGHAWVFAPDDFVWNP